MIQQHKIRASFLFLFFVFCYVLVLLRLMYIQLIQHSFFTDLGQKQYNVVLTMCPERAPIVDRTGKNYLAINNDAVATFILPRQIKNREQLNNFLKNHFPHAFQRLAQHPQAHFLYVQRKITPEQKKLIIDNNIIDIYFLNEPSRFYPCTAAAPLIGLTDIDNKGLFGIELQFDQQLSGASTQVTLEKDARSGLYYFTKETTKEGVCAQPLTLTIDSELQFLTYEELTRTVKEYNAKQASAVIVNPDNGEILAMAVFPTFDPHNFDANDLSLTKNTIITEAYELGSVFKICTAIAALEEEVVTLDELIDCKDTKTTYIEGRKINTVIPAGIIPFKEVIAKSNNIGIAQVAQRLGPRLYDHYTTLGFGQKVDIPFPGQNKGFINPPWQWSKQSLFSLSYGYEVTANVLQMARAMCIIASGGYWVDLQLLMHYKAPLKKSKLYSDETMDAIQDILEQTTASGTAQKARIQGYRVMCKTGTANLLENGVYNPDKNIFTCAGIIQKGNYKRVIVVFIKEPAQKDLYASVVAAPLFEQIAEKVLIKDRII